MLLAFYGDGKQWQTVANFFPILFILGIKTGHKHKERNGKVHYHAVLNVGTVL